MRNGGMEAEEVEYRFAKFARISFGTTLSHRRRSEAMGGGG